MSEHITPTADEAVEEERADLRRPEPAPAEPGSFEEPPAEEALTTEDGDSIEDDEDDPARSFQDMNLDANVLRALDDMGYERPMEVQTAVFDTIQAGHDIMVQARTGTGKTAAFGIPLVQAIKESAHGPQALILAPTRELGLQVARELALITAHRGIQVVAIYGGAPMKPQVDALEAGAQIVAGTPGRVLDHIRRGTLKTGQIKHLVLDECDEMLSMGFQEEIERIIDTLPPKDKRQTLLFSATIPNEIQRIARRHMCDPIEISLSDGSIHVEEVNHAYYIVSGMAKTKDLLKVIKAEKPEQAIIFCNTREDTTTVAKYLRRQGYDALAISSDLSQRERESVMKKMREGNVRFMCATDVAARGIDINDLSHVINYGFPESPEVYVHRTGRTGRAGKRGTALSLVGPREIGSFYFLKLTYKIVPEERELPTAEEFALMQEVERYEQIVNWINEEAPEEYKSLARRLWDSDNGERVLGALLQRVFADKEAERKRAEAKERAEFAEPEEGATEGGFEGGSRRPRRDRDGGGRSRSGGGRDERPRRPRAEAAAPAPARALPVADDAAEADAPPVSADAEPTAPVDAAAVADSDSDTDEGGEPRRRRRRRRRSGSGAGRDGGSNGASTGSSASSDGKEFWETWADEKTAGTESAAGTTESADADESADGDETAEARPARSPRSRERSRERDEDDADVGGTARLYVNIGKREKVTVDEVRQFLSDTVGDGADQIGAIALRNTHCYVRVPDDLVERVIETVNGTSFKEREVLIERARARR
jgi:ATP-dependent RNA helicase DeaD